MKFVAGLVAAIVGGMVIAGMGFEMAAGIFFLAALVGGVYWQAS